MKASFGHWTTAKAVVAGALAIAGAVGSALAISPTISPPIKWQGGWEVSVPSFNGVLWVYLVPAGRNLLLTDLVLGNDGTTPVSFFLYRGTTQLCGDIAAYRLANVVVPPASSIVVPLTTGIGFASTHAVCAEVTGGTVSLNGRGFLFTPS